MNSQSIRHMTIAVLLGLASTCAGWGQALLNSNLVVNGGAEAGPGVINDTVVPSIPGWTRTGNATVLRYGPEANVDFNTLGPVNRGVNFFAGGPSNASSSLTQVIDLTAAATTIDTGGAVYQLSGYLGGYLAYLDSPTLRADFRNASGSTTSSVTLGPVTPDERAFGDTGLRYRSATAMLPQGVRSVAITLTFTRESGHQFNNAFADNISFVLTAPTSISYGANLIVNGDAELGKNDVDYKDDPVLDIPGWAPTGSFTVLDYSDDGAPDRASAGPAGAGRSFFAGGPANALSTLLQQIAVAGGASAIDRGAVTFQLSGYIGGYANQDDNLRVDITFRGISGNSLGTNSIGPVLSADRGSVTTLRPRSVSGTVPVGTRVIDVKLTSTRTDGTYNDGYADNLSLVLTGPPTGPVINPGGIANAASYSAAAVSPGEIVTIFGTNIGPANLSTLTVSNGSVDTQLGGTRVLFNNVPAPLIYVTASQISAVVPYEIANNVSASVVVENQGVRSGAVSIPVTSAVPGIFTLDKSGRGPGAILNQDNSVNSSSNPALVGSVIIIYATGEGQTIPAGRTGLVNVSSLPKPAGAVTVTIGGQSAVVNYAGAAPGFVSGVFQVNAVIPAGTAPSSTVPVKIQVGPAVSLDGVTVAVR